MISWVNICKSVIGVEPVTSLSLNKIILGGNEIAPDSYLVGILGRLVTKTTILLSKLIPIVSLKRFLN